MVDIVRKDAKEKEDGLTIGKSIFALGVSLAACIFIGSLLWGGLELIAFSGLPVPTFPFFRGVIPVGLGFILIGLAFNLCFTSMDRIERKEK